MREITTSSEQIYEGSVLSLRKDEVQLSNGNAASREIVEHHGSVCILAIKKYGQVMLVRQFRKPADQPLLELPAGSVEEGESPQEAAQRELLEECGLKAAKWTPLFECYLAPGYSTEYMHGYLAEDLEVVEAQPEEDEIIDAEDYTLEELFPMIDDGRIRDAKTICGLLQWSRMSAQQKTTESDEPTKIELTAK